MLMFGLVLVIFFFTSGIHVGVGWPMGLLVGWLFSARACLAGVDGSRRSRWPSQFSLLRLTVQGIVLVLL